MAQPEPILRCELSGVVCWWMGTMVWFLVQHFGVVSGGALWLVVDNGGGLLLYGRPHGMMADNARQIPPQIPPISGRSLDPPMSSESGLSSTRFHLGCILPAATMDPIDGNPAISKRKPEAHVLMF